jgi:hypothetical protein
MIHPIRAAGDFTQNAPFWVTCNPWAPGQLASRQCSGVCGWRVSKVGLASHIRNGNFGEV